MNRPVIIFVRKDYNSTPYKLVLKNDMNMNELNQMIFSLFKCEIFAFENKFNTIIPINTLCKQSSLYNGQLLTIITSNELNSTIFSIRSDDSYQTYDYNDIKTLSYLSNEASITLESLWGQFRNCIDNNNGMMNLNSFSEIIQGLCAKSNLNTIGGDLWSIYDMFDIESNGEVNSYELACALTVLSGGDKQSKMWLGFNLIDIEQIGVLSLTQLCQYLQSYLLIIVGLSSLKTSFTKQQLYNVVLRTANLAARSVFELSTTYRQEIDAISFQELLDFMNAFPLFLQWFRVLDMLDVTNNNENKNNNNDDVPEVQTLLHGITVEDLETMLMVRANSDWLQVDLPDVPINRETFLQYMSELIQSTVPSCVYDDVFVSLECLFDSLSIEDDERKVEPSDLVLATLPLSQTPFSEQLQLAFAYNGDPQTLNAGQFIHMLKVYVLTCLSFSQTSRDMNPYELNEHATELAINIAMDVLDNQDDITFAQFTSTTLPLWLQLLQIIAAPSNNNTTNTAFVLKEGINDPLNNVDITQLNDLAMLSHFTNLFGTNVLVNAIQEVENDSYVNFQEFLDTIEWPTDLYRLLASKLFLTIDCGLTNYVHADELCLGVVLTWRAPLSEKWDYMIDQIFGEDISFNIFALIIRCMLKLVLGKNADINNLDQSAVNYALNIYQVCDLSHEEYITAEHVESCLIEHEELSWMDVFWSQDEKRMVIDVPIGNGARLYQIMCEQLSQISIPQLVELYSNIVNETSEPKRVFMKLFVTLLQSHDFIALADNIYCIFESAVNGPPDMKTLLIPLMFMCASNVPISSKFLTVWMISCDNDEGRLSLRETYEILASFMKFSAVLNEYDPDSPFIPMATLNTLNSLVAKRAEEMIVNIFAQLQPDNIEKDTVNTIVYYDFMDIVQQQRGLVPWLQYLLSSDDDNINNNNEENEEEEEEEDVIVPADESEIVKRKKNVPTQITVASTTPRHTLNQSLFVSGHAIVATPTGTRVRPRANSVASSDGVLLYCDYDEPASPLTPADIGIELPISPRPKSPGDIGVELPIIGRKLCSPLPDTDNENVEEVICVDTGSNLASPRYMGDESYTLIQSAPNSPGFLVTGRAISATPTGTKVRYHRASSYDGVEDEEVLDIDLAVTGKSIPLELVKQGSFTFEEACSNIIDVPKETDEAWEKGREMARQMIEKTISPFTTNKH